MSDFSLTILGSSSALPTSTRSLSAHVLNVRGRFFLIDCGEGTQIQLRKYHIPMTKINQIFISHLHGDHFYGLMGLISTLNLMGKRGKVEIYAHSDLQKIINPFIDYFDKKLSFEIEFISISPNKNKVIYEDKHLTVETIPLKHRIPTCGFLIKEKERSRTLKKGMKEFYNIPLTYIKSIKNGNDFVNENGEIIANEKLTDNPPPTRSYAYCSDTRFFEKVINIVEKVDLLYHEATFENKDVELAKQTYHSTSKQAAEIAKKANVGKLLIGHFSTRYKNVDNLIEQAKEVFSNTSAVNDGDVFELPYPKRS